MPATGFGTRLRGVMRRIAPLAAAVTLSVWTWAGCLTTPPPVAFAPEPLPRLAAAPTTPPKDLPGVDTGKLSEREKAGWWNVVSRLYAPCPDQAISVAQCVEEQRPCAGCAPMARLLADRIHAGDTTSDAELAAAARFGKDVRTIDVADSPSRGPANAPVTIVVWGDFECGACARMMPLLDEVAEKHPNEVRVVHKFYPLPKHPFAKSAAMAAWAAHRQGKYWEFERKLFMDQTRLSEPDLVRHAKDLGLDASRFEADRTSAEAERIVERDKAAADAAGLTGTPHVMVNGRRFVPWGDPSKDLEDWVRLELELRGPARSDPQPAVLRPSTETSSNP